jgi:type I thyroxine 5'-deiodinase
MEKLYKQYRDTSQWLLVYIDEVHPANGWQAETNVESGYEVNQPENIEERLAMARICHKKLRVSLPVIVDNMDDKTSAAYAGWPDRLYIVDKEGKIAYKGRKGPRGFRLMEMKEALNKILSFQEH